MSGVFLATQDGRARELTSFAWLAWRAALPPQVSAAVEAGDIVRFMSITLWRRER